MRSIISLIFQLLYFAMLARILLSWIPHDRYHPIVQKLYAFTDPILEPFQRLIPPGKLGIDISPIFAFFALNLIENFIYRLI